MNVVQLSLNPSKTELIIIDLPEPTTSSRTRTLTHLILCLLTLALKDTPPNIYPASSDSLATGLEPHTDYTLIYAALVNKLVLCAWLSSGA